MSNDNQRIAELEKEVTHLKKAISHNNDLIVGLERALLDTVYTLVEEDDDLQKRLIERFRDKVKDFDNTTYKKYRSTVEFGDPDTQLTSPAGLLSRHILFDSLSSSLSINQKI